ncbi:AraC family transcriptional regulator [Paenibacillus sp. MWE-103]|uniref:AraC family transcriptional regulator n=1 Tax=Paenibacillus artemisiicola TaxID=1172618 RepID=A0ABS3WIS6_9BACL|nr:AraC family transcriptional regulator [Paenibacillus artemisiicola]MBO7748223.1 AraC family transcriptional regulator [Paenibacillus artemisiicola]
MCGHSPADLPLPKTIAWDDLQPVVWYANRMQCPPGFVFGPRVIDEHQFILVADGRGSAWIQGERYDAVPGSLFYYGPETVHRFEADRERPFLLYGLHFSWTGEYAGTGAGISIRETSFDPAADAKRDNRMVVESPGRPEDDLTIGDVRELPAERFEPLFARIAECYGMEDRGFKASLLRGLLLELIASIKQGERREGRQPISPLVAGIAERLARRARERYDRRWLGEWSAYHPDYIARQFRAQLGVAPYDYFMARKLQLAKDLLAHTELPLLAIAAELEAGSIHNFTKWFKQRAGVPPGKFRGDSRFI